MHCTYITEAERTKSDFNVEWLWLKFHYLIITMKCSEEKRANDDDRCRRCCCCCRYLDDKNHTQFLRSKHWIGTYRSTHIEEKPAQKKSCICNVCCVFFLSLLFPVVCYLLSMELILPNTLYKSAVIVLTKRIEVTCEQLMLI